MMNIVRPEEVEGRPNGDRSRNGEAVSADSGADGHDDDATDIDEALAMLGADILDEPIPESLLKVLEGR